MTPFDVILVPFPFSDLSANKKRPCLILSAFKPRAYREHYIIAMITSNVTGIKFPHDFEIKDIKTAGLPLPSIIRLSKVVTIESSLVLKKLGRLGAADQREFRQEFKKLFESVLSK